MRVSRGDRNPSGSFPPSPMSGLAQQCKRGAHGARSALLSDNMVRLINGWTKADVLARFDEHCTGFDRSPELLVDRNGKCCAIGALLPETARKALQAWSPEVARAYASQGAEPTGLTIVHTYLDDASPGWRESVPFEIFDGITLPWVWCDLMSAFDVAHCHGELPVSAARLWADTVIEE